MSLLVSAGVTAALGWVPAAWLEKGLYHSCGFSDVLVYKLYKTQKEKMQHVQKDLLNFQGDQLAIIQSENCLFVCSGLSVSITGVCFKSQKKQREAPIYSYFSGMETTGKINKRKVRGNENQENITTNSSLTSTWTVQLQFKKPTKPHLQIEAMKLFY